MNDTTGFPTASQAEALVAAYRVWIDTDSGDDDDAMAAAMFANLPGGGPGDHERCVTVDGFAVVAQRNRQDPAGTVYQLESYALDGHIDIFAASAPAAPTAAANPFSYLAHAETA